jgi:hypothetical protein
VTEAGQENPSNAAIAIGLTVRTALSPTRCKSIVILALWALKPAVVVPSYTALDLRVGWQLSSNLDLSLLGQNLLGGGHGEFTDVATRTDFKGAVFLKLLCRL